MDNKAANEMSLKLLGGRILTIRRDELSAIVFHELTIGLVGVVAFIQLAANVYPELNGLLVRNRILILLFFTLLSWTVMFATFVVTAHITRKPVPGFFLSIAVATVQSTIAVGFRYYLLGDARLIGLPVYWVFIFVIAELLLTFFGFVLFPIIRKGLSHSSPVMEETQVAHGPVQQTAPTTDRQHTPLIALDKMAVPATHVRLMRSEGIYTRVMTDSDEYLQDKSLKSLCEQMPPELGLRVQRSYWVAFRMIKQARRTGRDVVLDLHDGTHVPVARSLQRYILALVRARLQTD